MARANTKWQWAVVVVAFVGQSAMAVELAKVNGRAVTEKDLHAALGTLNEAQRNKLLSDPNARRQLLLNVINQEVIAQEAEKQKMDQDANFKDAMNIFKKQYLANRILDKVVGPRLTDEGARKYYAAHKPEFNTDTVHVQHILVEDEKTARAIFAEATQPNADFQALAEKRSRDTSARNNRGDLGFVARGQMVPEFEAAAFSAEDGKVVGPVRTAFGYHVIKVIERKIGKTLPYDEVEMTVKNAMQRELVETYAASLKKGAKVEINEANLKAYK